MAARFLYESLVNCPFLNLPPPPPPPSPLSLPQGYSGGVIYDGQYVSNSSSTVVVTINYRLGAIGFLVYGSPTEDNAIDGNFGIKVHSIRTLYIYITVYIIILYNYVTIVSLSLYIIIYGSVGPTSCSGVGAGQHCRLWRRPKRRHAVGSKCGSHLHSDPHDVGAEQRAVPQGGPAPVVAPHPPWLVCCHLQHYAWGRVWGRVRGCAMGVQGACNCKMTLFYVGINIIDKSEAPFNVPNQPSCHVSLLT